MTTPEPRTTAPRSPDTAAIRRAMEVAVRIGIVAALIAWAFLLIAPFILPVVWGIIIAVAIYPLYLRICRWTGGREKLAATLFSGVTILLLVVPTILFTGALVQNVRALAERIAAGTLRVPPPPDALAKWPVLGSQLHEAWSLASRNLGKALQQMEPQIEALSGAVLAFVRDAGMGLLIFLAALAIAGVMLASARGGRRFADALAERLAPGRGTAFVDLATATVRSVSRGILGVAFIQSALMGLGFVVAGVPFAGVWTLVALLLSVVQVGPGLVAVGAVVYVFQTADTTTAVVFLIWNVLIAPIDNVLKPLLLARGVAVPMPVIFVGAIGGFLRSGIVGLFVGPVVLAVAYTVFIAWLGAPDGPGTAPEEAVSDQGSGGAASSDPA